MNTLFFNGSEICQKLIGPAKFENTILSKREIEKSQKILMGIYLEYKEMVFYKFMDMKNISIEFMLSKPQHNPNTTSKQRLG